MLFFRKKKPTAPKSFYPNGDRIHVSWGGYWDELNDVKRADAFLLIPGEDVDTTVFRSLAMDCAEHLLSDGAVVLNNLFCCLGIPNEGHLSKEPCVMEYVAQGGTPVFESKSSLYTISCGIDRRLVDCVSKEGYGYYGFSFHKYSTVENAPFKLDLTIGYHEDHQYLEVIAPGGISEYADAVVSFCKARGWDIVVPEDNM